MPTDYAGKYVFPGLQIDSRPMSEVAVLAALRSKGIDNDTVTGHGSRLPCHGPRALGRGFWIPAGHHRAPAGPPGKGP